MKFISLNQLPLFTDDFFWKDLPDAGDEKDALVIHNPQDALVTTPVCLRSRKSLEEHIAHVRENHIKKAVLIVKDISFIKQCPELEYLMVFPAVDAENFDYSPLYEMPNIKWLQCETVYGIEEDKVSDIDYSRFDKLERITVTGKGNHNIHMAQRVVELSLYSDFSPSKTLEGVLPGKSLQTLLIGQAKIGSLAGIEAATRLRRLDLEYNRSLTDISALSHLKDTLAYLSIEVCGKIRDFSVLHELRNLEFLILKGSNVIPDLSFVESMPKLKHLHITMNVQDGNMTPCLRLPYARIQNRKHYTHKDKDMPQMWINPDKEYPFHIV